MMDADVGFYGKLPSHGDFLRRRVSDAFVEVWDGWLQASVAASRAALGVRWLDIYLTSPVWRFACASGACGPSPVIGLMVPSVDRVGRYFPLALIAEMARDVSPITAALESASFFERAEQLMVDALASDTLNFDAFDASVTALRSELRDDALMPPVLLDTSAAALVNDATTDRWHIPIGSASLLGTVFHQLLSARLGALYGPLVVWWTEGSSMVEPGCLITSGLPDPDGFASFLDGSWTARRWGNVSARVDVVLEKPPESPPSRFRSAAATHVGRVRQVNQDAFLERSEIGLWAVADGLGGHRDGDIASRMVCDALADVNPQPSFADTIAAARQRLIQVNDQLLRERAHGPLAERSASTVVVLLARGSGGAMLWAGDSRVYRCRGGQLERLTCDHSVDDSDPATGRQISSTITRAIGIESKLLLDQEQAQVRPGDRFLLCSDGLTRIIPEAAIRDQMQRVDIRTAVDALMKAAMDAGAPDNVTVLIVEAES